MIEGGSNIVSVDNETDVLMPGAYHLYQNYPNPFNPSTYISYQLPKSDFVTLKVFDVLGREIKTLVNKYQDAGKHSIEFNAATLASGMYIYRIYAGTFNDTKKLLFLK